MAQAQMAQARAAAHVQFATSAWCHVQAPAAAPAEDAPAPPAATGEHAQQTIADVLLAPTAEEKALEAASEVSQDGDSQGLVEKLESMPEAGADIAAAGDTPPLMPLEISVETSEPAAPEEVDVAAAEEGGGLEDDSAHTLKALEVDATPLADVLESANADAAGGTAAIEASQVDEADDAVDALPHAGTAEIVFRSEASEPTVQGLPDEAASTTKANADAPDAPADEPAPEASSDEPAPDAAGEQAE